MEMEEVENIDFEVKDLSLIDLESPGDFQFSENLSDLTTHDTINSIDAVKQFPNLHEISEPKISHRSGRYNLRKSLAWDSAFFTSGGVLDPEELSTMLKGTEKSQKYLLPGIEEDISVSTESISNLESDNLAMDGLETDLFVDIRASIQRSSKKVSNLTNSGIEAMETDNTAISSLKKEELVSQNKNPKPTFKKTSGMQTIRMSKYQPKPNIVKLGSGKAVKQDSDHSQVTQSMAKIGESNKPPTPISKHIPLSAAAAKQDSMGSICVKSECGSSKLVSDKGTQSSKVCSTGARRSVPKPALSSKSSLLGSSTTCKGQSTRSCTLSDSSSSISSKAPAKSSQMVARRNVVKIDAGKASSGSISKTPSRTAVKKIPVHTLSAYLMSTKISSSVSPDSSISEWSSASSTSSLMVSQGYADHPRIKPDMSSCRSIDNDPVLSDTRNHSIDQIVDGPKSHGIVLPCNSSTKSSTCPCPGAHQASKPSGLRMPSPKIGFFDGGKSLARTPNGAPQSQFGLHAAIPKSTVVICSPTRTRNPNIDLESDEKDSPSLSLEVKGITTGENCSKARKLLVENGPKEVVYSGCTGQKVDEDILVNTYPICKTSDKENGRAKDPVEGLRAHNEDVIPHISSSTAEILKDTSDYASLSFPETASKSAPRRSPFTLKNVFCNNESFDISKEPASQAADKTILLFPSSDQKENS